MSQVLRLKIHAGFGLKQQTEIRDAIALHNPPSCPTNCHALPHQESLHPSAATKLPHLFSSRNIHSQKWPLNIDPLQSDRMNDLHGVVGTRPHARCRPLPVFAFEMRPPSNHWEKSDKEWVLDTGRKIYAKMRSNVQTVEAGASPQGALRRAVYRGRHVKRE